MKSLTLTKHHGLGNDFLVGFPPTPFADDQLADLARRLCERRRGVGADGLLIGGSSDDDRARLTVVNSDGSRAELSGNGIRCFAQALARRDGTTSARFTVTTDAGPRDVEVVPTEDPATVLASVDMGEVVELGEPEGWAALGADPSRPVAHLGIGNPHSVVAVDDVAAVDLTALGELVPSVNLEVVQAGPEPGAVTMRVHERGAGITEACGSGACAVAVAAARWGLAAPGPEIVVHMPGGSARVALDRPAAGRVTLTGPATYVATIEVPLP